MAQGGDAEPVAHAKAAVLPQDRLRGGEGQKMVQADRGFVGQGDLGEWELVYFHDFVGLKRAVSAPEKDRVVRAEIRHAELAVFQLVPGFGVQGERLVLQLVLQGGKKVNQFFHFQFLLCSRANAAR